MANPDTDAMLGLELPPAEGQPSAMSREMMRTLGDKLQIDLGMAIGLVRTAADAGIAALRAGQWDRFSLALEHMNKALDRIGIVGDPIAKTSEALEALDPGYMATVDRTIEGIQLRKTRARLENASTLQLGLEYMAHKSTCKHGPSCPLLTMIDELGRKAGARFR